VRVATDVTNPMLGPNGAAAIFAPQKGAGAREVRRLEASLTVWAEALERAGTIPLGDLPGTGAGGGISGAAMGALGARVESGLDLVVELTGAAAAMQGADLVITGEGSLDQQSLAGKAPAGIAALGRRHRVPVLAIAGRVSLGAGELKAAGIDGIRALVDYAPTIEHAQRNAHVLLRSQTSELVREWLDSRRAT
jgi:glycerate kinase